MDPQSLNLYVYCNDNPVMYVDPSGHFKVVSVNVAGSIFNVALSWAVGGGFGYAAVATYIRKKGKEAAKRLFYKTLKDKLLAIGAGALATGLGKAIDFALDYTDIGGMAAKALDKRDKHPGNGWLDI